MRHIIIFYEIYLVSRPSSPGRLVQLNVFYSVSVKLVDILPVTSPIGVLVKTVCLAVNEPQEALAKFICKKKTEVAISFTSKMKHTSPDPTQEIKPVITNISCY